MATRQPVGVIYSRAQVIDAVRSEADRQAILGPVFGRLPESALVAQAAIIRGRRHVREVPIADFEERWEQSDRSNVYCTASKLLPNPVVLKTAEHSESIANWMLMRCD